MYITCIHKGKTVLFFQHRAPEGAIGAALENVPTPFFRPFWVILGQWSKNGLFLAKYRRHKKHYRFFL
jgi:hypothetical protein